jgi:hypothetical protein
MSDPAVRMVFGLPVHGLAPPVAAPADEVEAPTPAPPARPSSRPNGVGCLGCADLNRSYQAACERARELGEKNRALAEQVADLKHALTLREPSVRELVDLRARLERLANEEQSVRWRADQAEERAAALARTNTNLRARFTAAGIIP